MTNFTDYQAFLSNGELNELYETLQECWDQDLAMDGSGECGGIIAKHYEALITPIVEEMERRGMISHEEPTDFDFQEYYNSLI